MRPLVKITTLASTVLLAACMHKGANPDDPYESFNRKVYKFNMALDATFLKPPARLYKAVLPPFVRTGVNNAFNNINLIPTVGNDLLQAEWRYAIKDTWRFLINSTFGIAGLFDIADKRFSLPPHTNDLGLTFAKWGYKKSTYVMLPLLGPSTVRDSTGMLFEYTLMTPYAAINDMVVLYTLAGVRYIDLRSQFFDTERLINEALDPYAFIRDAYLQNRYFLITGQQINDATANSAEGDSNDGGDYVDDEADAKKPGNGVGSDYVDE